MTNLGHRFGVVAQRSVQDAAFALGRGPECQSCGRPARYRSDVVSAAIAVSPFARKAAQVAFKLLRRVAQ